MILKHMMTSAPVPPELLLPITKSPPTVLPYQSNSNISLSSSTFFFWHLLYTRSFTVNSSNLSKFISFPCKIAKKMVSCSGFPQGALIQSRGGAEEQMERNGGAREMWLLIRSTASVTPTRTVPVQESLWNYKLITQTPPTTSRKATLPPQTLNPSIRAKTLNSSTRHQTRLHFSPPRWPQPMANPGEQKEEFLQIKKENPL